MRALVVVDAGNRITFAAPVLEAAVGPLVGRYGHEVVDLPGTPPCTADAAQAILAAVRATGSITIRDYWIVGPAGRVWVKKNLLSYARAGGADLWMADLTCEVFSHVHRFNLTPLERGGMLSGMTTDVLTVGESVSDAVVEWKAQLERRNRDHRYIAQGIKIINDFAGGAGIGVVGDITGRAIEAYLDRIHKAGASPTTQNKHLGYLSSFLTWCQRTERVKDNPARRIPRATEYREGGNRAFSAEEAARLIAVARADAESPHPRFKAVDRWRMYAMAWHTGLRRSELRRLRVMHLLLNDEPPRVIVPANVGRKAKGREDTVPIAPELLAVLREQVRGKDRRDPVFSFCRDETVIKDIEAAGIPRQIDGRTTGLHSLRKGLATQLAMTGTPEAVAQKLLRHFGSEAHSQCVHRCEVTAACTGGCVGRGGDRFDAREKKCAEYS